MMYYLGFETNILFDENFNRKIIYNIFLENLKRADYIKLIIPKKEEKLIDLLEEYSVYSEDVYFGISESIIIEKDMEDILSKKLFDKNSLKFLELNLYGKDKLILEINSFGSEIYVYELDEKSSQELAEKLEKNYNIKSQIFYDEDESKSVKENKIEHHHHDNICKDGCNYNHNPNRNH